MPNKMERFTQRARRTLSLAQEAADRLHQHQIRPEHMLLGLMREDGGIAGRALRDLGLDSLRIEEQVMLISPAAEERSSEQLDLSAGAKRVLELSVDEARRLSHNYIGTEHLLLGLLRLPDSAALGILRQLNVSPYRVRRQVDFILQRNPAPAPPPDPSAPSRTSSLREIEYFLLRTTSRSSGGLSHLPLELSSEVKDALEEALKEVGYSGFTHLEERHLLLGLLHKRESVLSRFLIAAEVDLDDFIRQLRHSDDS